MESNPPSDPSDLPTQTNGECVIEDDTHRILKLLADDVDRFIASLSSIPNKPNSKAPKITASAETYVDMVESDLERDDSSLLAVKSVLVDSMARLEELKSLLSKFLPGENTTPWVSKMSLVLQKAMALLEDELRNILEEFVSSSSMYCALIPSPSDKTPKAMKQFSSLHSHVHRRQDSEPGSNQQYSSSTLVSDLESYPTEEDNFPAIPGETIVQMRVITAAMIASGYETECCQVYTVIRRNAFKSALKSRGFRKLSIDEIGKMSWEQLEPHTTTWNKVVRHTARILYPREYNLCSEVFSAYPPICEGIMTNLARAVVILFLNFAEGIAMTKRAAERLFKVIEIYQSLIELESAIEIWKLPQETKNELQSEISSVQLRLGEAVSAIFSDLEESISNDPTKNIVPGGAVHPLTRYTMNYIQCACNFKDILETIFQKMSFNNDKATKIKSPFSLELSRILSFLDTNLEAKSKQYKDVSLSYVFLMNNGRYILQKIKEAPEVHELVGRVVGRKRSTELRAHHKSYQRETWSKVLQCLNHEGLQVHGKVHKPILKERFKSFNQMLDEIHKTQIAWVVSDEQLQSELRVSVSSVMIPAYRSFVARFGQYFTPGRQVEKYIKYQPEDIEATIDDLFDGNPNLVGKSKKGGSLNF